LPDRAKEIVPTTAVPQYLDWLMEVLMEGPVICWHSPLLRSVL
jgi:hypothetical protein